MLDASPGKDALANDQNADATLAAPVAYPLLTGNPERSEMHFQARKESSDENETDDADDDTFFNLHGGC